MVVVSVRICDAAEDLCLPVLIAIVGVRDRVAGAVGVVPRLARKLIAVVETERGYRLSIAGSPIPPKVALMYTTRSSL